MALRLFNTLTDRKEEFVPLLPGEVRMYVCGPTVYAASHLGHGRCYVVWDIVARYLRFRGFQVKYVRNYTDVDDKIIRDANKAGVPPIEFARRCSDDFDRDMAALGNALPDVTPRVTETIPEIIAIIEKLITGGHAYESQGDVYFSVRSYAPYGRLSKRNIDDLRAGARVEPGDRKRDPLDFALWKTAKPGEISWDSPWGKGRPGWHIECSAMSAKFLGETFDIHAGGKDLVFPHHENEVAQSEAASHKPLSRYWMHNGFVQVAGEKQSKTEAEKNAKVLERFATIRSSLEVVDPQALRLFMLGTQYRAPIEFSADSVFDAQKRIEYIYETLAKVDAKLGPTPPALEGELLEPERVGALISGFTEAMDDDFNTAEAIGRLSAYLAWMNELTDASPAGAPKATVRRTIARLRADFGTVAQVLAIGHEPPRAALDRIRALHAKNRNIDSEQVDALIRARTEARKARDFARADAIREEAAALGVEIMDTPQGTTWRVV